MTSDVEKFIGFCVSELGKNVTDMEASYIRKHLKAGDRILNVGCGIGWLEEKLHDFDITGLD
ncbi:MAG: SAM-dependent methyltransferase, partial [Candidatus Hadarchaeota archaeon]